MGAPLVAKALSFQSPKANNTAASRYGPSSSEAVTSLGLRPPRNNSNSLVVIDDDDDMDGMEMDEDDDDEVVILDDGDDEEEEDDEGTDEEDEDWDPSKSTPAVKGGGRQGTRAGARRSGSQDAHPPASAVRLLQGAEGGAGRASVLAASEQQVWGVFWDRCGTECAWTDERCYREGNSGHVWTHRATHPGGGCRSRSNDIAYRRLPFLDPIDIIHTSHSLDLSFPLHTSLPPVFMWRSRSLSI